MLKDTLNKGISTPIAIGIVLILVILVGSFTWWQYGEMWKEETNLPEIEIPEKEEEKLSEGTYMPLEDMSSEEKLISYLEKFCSWRSDGVSKEKLVKDYPDFYILKCSGGGACVGGSDMHIYLINKETRLLKTVWESEIFSWGLKKPQYVSLEIMAAGAPYKYLFDSEVEFEDLDGDGNLEIVQNITEMKCDSEYGYEKSESPCWPEDFCVEEGLVSKKEYQKVFKWNEGEQLFLENID